MTRKRMDGFHVVKTTQCITCADFGSFTNPGSFCFFFYETLTDYFRGDFSVERLERISEYLCVESPARITGSDLLPNPTASECTGVSVIRRYVAASSVSPRHACVGSASCDSRDSDGSTNHETPGSTCSRSYTELASRL